ncbi:DUF6578 domain-containing protein [Glutamicibacter arilaitensis]|uniref:DUF6578 domain-containing protein n=1 Tax=Glutamicibacter arilaitensis TaxID=256701 RepID=UPI00384F4802
MQIKVELDGSLHGCCGSAFSTGDTIRWVLGQLRSPNGEISFQLDDHEQLSTSGVPVAPVTARVLAIEYVDRRYVSAVGDPRQMIPADEPPAVTAVVSVPEGADFDHDAILVYLDVADEELLPRVHDWNPQADFEMTDELDRLEELRSWSFRASNLRQKLVELLESLKGTYGNVATIRFDQLGNA